MQRLKARVADLSGRRRHALALLLGASAALALPPVHAVPFLVPAFVGLLWLVEGSQKRRSAFAVGFSFGVGFFLAGLYWIAIAFATDPRHPAWMGPPAVLALAAIQALFPALVAGLLAATRRRGLAAVFLLAALWIAAEWLRGWAFTGFPWNLMGSVWAFSDAMIQATAYVGTYGLGLLTVFVAAVPAVLGDPAPGRGRAVVLAAFSSLALVWVGGEARLGGAEAGEVDGVRLRLVQPDIPQALKWVPELRKDHVVKQLEMSRAPAEGPPPTHVIWGETMVPFLLGRTPGVVSAIGATTPTGGLTIVGAPRTTPEREETFRIWNSLQAIDAQGRIVGSYDKSHLVPFGEYVPLRGILPIDKLVVGASDFSAGPGRVTLRLPGLPPVAPLICYEVIFPARVVSEGDRPAWILNLTNDSWYGHSSGPYQHFAASRLRAVEEGLPLVRVANGGISGVTDAYGRVVAFLGLGRSGVVDASLPRPLASPGPYARWGDGLVAAMLLLIALAGMIVPGKRCDDRP